MTEQKIIKARTSRDLGYAIVITVARQVFGGHLLAKDGRTVALADARHCSHWAADGWGLFSLAFTGPTERCVVGPPLPVMFVEDVVFTVFCTVAAKRQWEEANWKANWKGCG